MTTDEIACRLACAELLARLFAAFDRNDNDGAIALFADDGVIVTPHGRVSGADLKKTIQGRSPDVLTRHIMTNVVVTPDGADKARLECYAIFYRVQLPAGGQRPLPLPATPQGVSELIMEARRTVDGWRVTLYEPVPVLAPAQ